MRLKELREMPVTELEERVRELTKELFDLRLQAAVESPDNTGRVTAIRQEIARSKTIIREAELAEQGKREKREKILYRKKRRRRLVQSTKKR